MLTKRIIPCLDVDHGRVVKGKKFKDIQDVADPVELGRYYSEQGADELVFYDITASYEERDIFINIVEKAVSYTHLFHLSLIPACRSYPQQPLKTGSENPDYP